MLFVFFPLSPHLDSLIFFLLFSPLSNWVVVVGSNWVVVVGWVDQIVMVGIDQVVVIGLVGSNLIVGCGSYYYYYYFKS